MGHAPARKPRQKVTAVWTAAAYRGDVLLTENAAGVAALGAARANWQPRGASLHVADEPVPVAEPVQHETSHGREGRNDRKRDRQRHDGRVDPGVAFGLQSQQRQQDDQDARGLGDEQRRL